MDTPLSPIRDPQNPHRIISVPTSFPEQAQWVKEEALLELIKDELARRRRVFVYAVYAERHDVVGRLTEILKRQGIHAEALRASVSADHREEWLEGAARRGVQVLIGNPSLVQTGLDLIDFPTLVFYETGYSIYLLRQASRRSWRIGQTKPVRVVYLAYSHTMQERAVQLMGKKLLASLALEGKFSTEGLLALAEGSDLAVELARTLVNGLNGLESAEMIWRTLSPPPAATALPTPGPEPAAAVDAEPAPTHMVLTVTRGRTAITERLAADQLDGITGQFGFSWLAEEAIRCP